MALINGLYINVPDGESVNNDVEISEHPIESGGNINDHVAKKPITISISGFIVNYGEGASQTKASVVLAKLQGFMNKGALVTYSGRKVYSGMMIKSISTDAAGTVHGGYKFSLEMVEGQIAKTSYVASVKKPISNQQITKPANPPSTKVYHTVKKGDTVWALVTKKYSSLKPKYSKVMDKCNWVMKQNPSAFSRKGDFGTLQVGKKLYMGDK